MAQTFSLPPDAQARMQMWLENQRKVDAKLLAGDGVMSGELEAPLHKVTPVRRFQGASPPHPTLPA